MDVLNLTDLVRLPMYGGKSSKSYWLQAPHDLEYSEVVKVTLLCDLEFFNFPFDSHVCDFCFGDPNYEVDGLEFDDVLAFYGNRGTSYGQPSIFFESPRLTFEVAIEAMKSYNRSRIALEDEIYSYAKIRLHLRRDSIGQLLAGFYIPTGIFAALSVLSFVISHEQVSKHCIALH